MTIAEFHPDPGYAKAFAELMSRIAGMLGDGLSGGPVTVCVAGGAALHIYTGARYSVDVDAKLFARAMLDPSQLKVAYQDAAGRSRILYYDTQYNDTFALMHEHAYDDALPIAVQGVDQQRLTIKLLAPLDLAVSKLARFSEQDREDIRTLAQAGLIAAKDLKTRAEAALPGYVGNLERIRNTIQIAAKDIAATRR